jgi:hypothetical protein
VSEDHHCYTEEKFKAMKQQMDAMQANRDLQHTTMKNMTA